MKRKLLNPDAMRYIQAENLVDRVEDGLKKAREKYGKSKQTHL